MRVLIQRVAKASVEIGGEVHSRSGRGLLVFLGVGTDDTAEDADRLVRKIVRLRIFDDEAGVMNLDVRSVGGDIMVVSQFTLHASTKKGNRPSYIHAAKEDIAIPLYEAFIGMLEAALGRKVTAGVFGADMQISLVNDGPVTIWIDSKNME